MTSMLQQKKNRLVSLLFVFLMLFLSYEILWPVIGLELMKVIQYLALIILLVASLAFFSDNKKSVLVWLFVLLLVHFIGLLRSDSEGTTAIKTAGFVLLTPMAFCCQNYDSKSFRRFCIWSSLLMIFSFFYILTQMRIVDEDSWGGGYYALCTLPVGCYFLKDSKPRYRIIWILVSFALVLLSIKRGDILAAILGICVYYFVQLKYNKEEKSSTFRSILLVIIAGIAIFLYFLNTSDLFLDRFIKTQEGDASNRDVIYSMLLNHYENSSLFVKLFGAGTAASVDITGGAAHQDWLEILTAEGLIGVFVYFCTFISLIKAGLSRTDVHEKSIILLICAIWFVKSMVSMFIYSPPSILLFVMVGYILNDKIDKTIYGY